MTYTPEQIARVCHHANRALQALHGDAVPSQPWDSETEETRRSAIAGVTFALKGGTPEDQHEEWVRHKTEAGWTYGPVKDADARTHPCLVPYAELPPQERVKDAVFTAVVTAMRTAG